MKDQTENQAIENFKISKIARSLKDFAFRDIKKVSEGDNVIASFILCACFIEQVATFRYGKEVGGKEFRDFVDDYLPAYNSEKLRLDLRNRLVHNYSIGETYALVQRHRIAHLQIDQGVTILNLENFIDDLEIALAIFLSQLKTDRKLIENAIKIYDEINIISDAPITFKNEP